MLSRGRCSRSVGENESGTEGGEGGGWEGAAPRDSIQGIPNGPGERGEKERLFLLRSENLRVKKGERQNRK